MRSTIKGAILCMSLMQMATCSVNFGLAQNYAQPKKTYVASSRLPGAAAQAIEAQVAKLDGALLMSKLVEAGFSKAFVDLGTLEIDHRFAGSISEIYCFQIMLNEDNSYSSFGLMSADQVQDPAIYVNIYFAILNDPDSEKGFYGAVPIFVMNSRSKIQGRLNDKPDALIMNIINKILDLYDQRGNRGKLVEVIRDQVAYQVHKQNASVTAFVRELIDVLGKQKTIDPNTAKGLISKLTDAAMGVKAQGQGDRRFGISKVVGYPDVVIDNEEPNEGMSDMQDIGSLSSMF